MTVWNFTPAARSQGARFKYCKASSPGGTCDGARSSRYWCSATAAFAVDVLSKTKGGRLVQVGLFGGEIKLALPVVAMRELTVGGSYVGTLQDLFELVALAQSGRLAPTIITTVPMEQANNALKRLDRGEVVGRIVFRSEQA